MSFNHNNAALLDARSYPELLKLILNLIEREGTSFSIIDLTGTLTPCLFNKIASLDPVGISELSIDYAEIIKNGGFERLINALLPIAVTKRGNIKKAKHLISRLIKESNPNINKGSINSLKQISALFKTINKSRFITPNLLDNSNKLSSHHILRCNPRHRHVFYYLDLYFNQLNLPANNLCDNKNHAVYIFDPEGHFCENTALASLLSTHMSRLRKRKVNFKYCTKEFDWRKVSRLPFTNNVKQTYSTTKGLNGEVSRIPETATNLEAYHRRVDGFECRFALKALSNYSVCFTKLGEHDHTKCTNYKR